MEEPVSGPSDEQIPEEGGDDETGVIPPADEQPAAPADPADPVPEAPADPAPEVPADPADPEVPVETPADPEAPVDEPAVEEPVEEDPSEEVGINDAEIDAKGDVYATLTIENYLKLKDQVTFTPGAGFTISSKGVITAKEKADGSKPDITLTIAAKSNWRITEVKKDDTAVEAAGGSYAITVEKAAGSVANSTVTVATVATYQAKAYGIAGKTLTVKTGDAADATATINTAAAAADATAVTLDKGRAMAFETNAAASDADHRLKVYYITDGSDEDDKVEIEPVTTPATSTTPAKTTYTVEQSVIDSLDGSIAILFVDEAKVAVTVAKATGAQDVDIEVEVPDDTPNAAAGAKKWVAYDAGTNNKVFPGETFKFRVKTAANYAIKAAKVGEDALTPGTAMPVTTGTGQSATTATWIPFEVAPTADTAVTVETAFDATKKSTLTFTLTGKAGSATAKITDVVPVTKEGAAATDAELAAALGIAEADLNLAPGEALDILTPTGTSAKVVVTVTPAANYALKAPTGVTLEANGSLKKTFEGTSLTSTLSVEAETEAAAVAAGTTKYFKITTADAENIKDISNCETTDKKVERKGTSPNFYYEVKTGVKTVTFTVNVKEGFKLADIAEAYSVKELSTTGGFTKYEVTLFASKLNVTSVTEGSEYTGAQDIALTKEALSYNVSVDPESSDAATYVATYQSKDNATANATFVDYDPENDAALSYNKALKAEIKPKANYELESVSYTMGGEPVEVPVEWDDSDVDGFEVARLNIAKVTDNVVITVKTEKKTVSLGTLAKVTDSSGITFADVTDKDGNGIYQIASGAKYVASVLDAGTPVADAKDVSVVVKDASGAAVAMTTPIITDKNNAKRRSFSVPASLAGQEITAEVSYKGAAVGTYIMQVAKKATELSVNGGAAITQSVDSVAYYPIVTNGKTPTDGNIAITDDEGTLSDKLVAEIKNGKLKVTVKPAKQSEVATSATSGTGENQTTTWTPMKSIIKVTSPDDPAIFDEVEISATPLFAEEGVKPTLTVDSAADVVMNVTVGIDAAQKPQLGYFEYSVTATPTAGTTEAPIPAELKSTNSTATWSDEKDTSVSGPVYVANSTNLGEGAAWTYKLTATVVYKDAQGTEIQTMTLTGDDAVSGSTEVPVFEDVLKLKKAKNTTFYSTWSDPEGVVIATPQWKNGKYRVLDEYAQIVDKTNGELNDYVGIKDGNVVLYGVPYNAKTGKHTIEVMATRDETGMGSGMGSEHTSYAARATVVVNVVRGIQDLSVTAPGRVLYMDAKKKSTTMKLGLVYNYGEKKNAPKTKKVTWDIYGLDSYGNPMGNGTPDESAYIKQYVTVKNGTVTVKGFVKDERHPNNNKFRVVVKAADFEGNNEKDYVDIEISNEKVEIGKVALVQLIDGKYKVVALQDGKKAQPVKAKDVNRAFILAVKSDSPAAVGSEYTYNQLKTRMLIQDPYTTSIKTNNKIAGVSYDENHEHWPYLVLTGTNKKISITVTANDGGKSKNVLPLSLEYTDIEGKDLSIDVGTTEYEDDVYDAKKVEKDGVEKEFTVNGAAQLYVSVKVGNNADETSTNFDTVADDFTNYKLAVKGGKKLSDARGEAKIVTTSEVTTITLTNPNVAKGQKAKVYTYKLINKAYAKTLNKAPKVTVKGQLYEYASAEEQKVTMTAMNGKEPVGDLYARVEADWSALGSNETKNDAIRFFNGKIDSGTEGGEHIFKINKDTGVIDLKFNDTSSSSMNRFTPGSYKVKVSIGTGSTEAQFKATYLPVNATIKVAKNKAFTFKPTSSYTINKVDGGAILGGKSNLKDNEIHMEFEELQNVNKKGKINKFTHYFKVVKDAKTDTYRLTFNEDDPMMQAMLFEPKKNGTEDMKDADGNVIYDTTKPKANPVITIPKEDLTGYVKYDVSTTKGYFTNTSHISGYAKITVKIAAEPKAGKQAKASQKYVPQDAEVKLAKDSKTEVNLKVNGAYVSAAFALIDDTKAKSNAAELALDTPAVNTDGQICFKAASALTEGKKYSTNLLVVPNNSWYARIIAAAPDQATGGAATNAEGETTPPATTPSVPTKAQLIKQYGIPVKITITAKANAKTTDKMVETPGGQTTEKTLAGAQAIISGLTWTDVKVKKDNATTLNVADKTAKQTAILDAIKAALAEEGYTDTVATLTVKTALALEDGNETAKVVFTLSVGGQSADVTVTIVAAVDEEEEPVVTTVEVSPTTPTVALGDRSQNGEQVFNATVKDASGNVMSGQTITWTLSGKTGAATDLSSDTGASVTLTVDKDEPAGSTIKVKATCGTVNSAEITVTVTADS